MANVNWKNVRESVKNHAKNGLGALLTNTRRSLHEVEKIVLRYPVSLARTPEEQANLIGLYFGTSADKLEGEIDKLSYFERKFLAEQFPRNEEAEKARKELDTRNPISRLEIASKLNFVRPHQYGKDDFLDTPLTNETLSRLASRSEKSFRPLNSEAWRKQAEEDKLFVDASHTKPPAFESHEISRQDLIDAYKKVSGGVGPAFETDFTVDGKTKTYTAEEADAKFGKLNHASAADNFRAELSELESRHNVSEEDRAEINNALSEIDRQSHLWAQNTGDALFDFDRINKILGRVGLMVVPCDSPKDRISMVNSSVARRAIQEDAEKVRQEFVNGAENNPTFGG